MDKIKSLDKELRDLHRKMLEAVHIKLRGATLNCNDGYFLRPLSASPSPSPHPVSAKMTPWSPATTSPGPGYQPLGTLQENMTSNKAVKGRQLTAISKGKQPSQNFVNKQHFGFPSSASFYNTQFILYPPSTTCGKLSSAIV